MTPYVQKGLEVIKKAGACSVFLICGDCTKVLEDVCQIGTNAFAIDEQLNLSYVRDLARKYGLGFAGNLKLTLALSLGLISPREDVIVSLATGGTHGYVLAPGCDLPYDVPVENMEQVAEAMDWFGENYASYPEASK